MKRESLSDKIKGLPTAPEYRVSTNIDEFVGEMKAVVPSVFGNVEWDSHCWDITEYESCRNPGKVNQRKKLVFTRLNGRANKIKVKLSDQKPFAPPFADLLKAFIVHRHRAKPKTKDNHMVAVRAFRYLYETLAAANHDPARLTHRHFMEAVSAVSKREAASSAYRIGIHLAEIAHVLFQKRLTAVRIIFKNPLKRPKCSDRNTPEARKKREKKLPSQEVIQAIGKLANMELTPSETIINRVLELLLVTGFRINEVLELPLNCLLEHETVDEDTGEQVVRWSIGYRARKGGGWQGKWLPDVAVPIVQRAVLDLNRLCEEAREVAGYHEGNDFKRLHSLRDRAREELLSTKELAKVFGIMGQKKGKMAGFLKRRGVEPLNPGKSPFLYRVEDVDRGLIKEVNKEPLVATPHRTILLSEALIVVFQQQFHNRKATLRYRPCPLQLGIIDDFLKGRPSADVPSIFDKYGLTGPEGESLSMTTHQPRHWLSTLAEEGGQLSELEIAAFFGRKYMGDNEAYNHDLNPAGDGKAVAEKIMEEHGLTREAIQRFVADFPLLDWQSAVEMADELGSSHVIDIGLCQADYAQSPCHKHLQCLRGCLLYKREKGNEKEISRLKNILKDTQNALGQARAAMSDEVWGANEWVRHHRKIIAGCKKALAVEEMDLPDGTMIVVFPDGENYSK